MQVIVFDKYFKAIYRIKNVPNDWNFLKVWKALELTHKPNEYQAIRLPDYESFGIDEYVCERDEFVPIKLNHNE